jgi:two-component system OmpR family sensor kinase
MSLRTKLLLIFGALSVSLVLGAASTASRASFGALINQVDERLLVISDEIQQNPLGSTEDVRQQFGPSVARIDLAADGRIIGEQPAGVPGESENLPALPEGIASAINVPLTVDARDSSVQYRILAVPRGEGRVTVVGVSLEQVDTAMGQIGLALLFGGLIALVGAGTLAAFFIRRETRKLDIVASTADAFAVGDFTTRAPVREDASEVGRVVLALNSMLDRVELSMLTEQDAQERLRRFIDDVSHELRTPVTTIHGYSELYEQGGLPSDADVERAMARIRNESARMAILIEELLTLARMDMQRVPARDVLDVGRIALAVAEDARVVRADHPISTHIEPDLLVRGDGPRLQQALLNLVTNALVHTPPGTAVLISAWSDGTDVSLEVHDDAGGIPPEELSRIFERTYRAGGDDSGDRRATSTGLGLSIVKRIVEEHGGVVETSSSPDSGTRFRIVLPRVEPGEPEPTPELGSAETAGDVVLGGPY